MSRREHVVVIIVSGSLLLYLCYSMTNGSVWLKASAPQPEPLVTPTDGSHIIHKAPGAFLAPGRTFPKNAFPASSRTFPKNAFPAPSRTFPKNSFPENFRQAGKKNEIRQVVFAKVHKAASSTVQNILLRFAMARNLSVLLPHGGPVISQSSSMINRQKVIPSITGNQLYDILCSHVLYEDKEINKYFPKSAFRVAIIREPMKQALSALTYYTVIWSVKDLTAGYEKHKTDPINGFLKHPEDFSGGRKCPYPGSFVNNRMSYDLGLKGIDMVGMQSNEPKMQAFLKKLENEFDLVLISDYFEKSMILLKRYLNWSMKDIVYIKVNEMQLNKSSVWCKKPNLASAELKTFKYCNRFDYVLYKHFLPIFFDKIEKESLFEEEVTAYKRVLKSVSDFCNNAKNGEKLLVQKSQWTDEFSVWKSDCAFMKKTEVDMVQTVREKQFNLHKEYTSHLLEQSPKLHVKNPLTLQQKP